MGNRITQFMTYVLGIDLGTTFSCVSVCVGNKVVVIANEEGCNTTPSYVKYVDGEVIVGNSAKERVGIDEGVVYDVKRLIGREYSSAGSDLKYLPYDVVCDDEERMMVSVDGKKLYLEEISADVLRYMKRIAESHLGVRVDKAVVTVPAYFNNSQRYATSCACKIAGLDVLRIVNEPTAAAIAYGLDNKLNELSDGCGKNVLVFDWGGGTLDLSILSMGDGLFQVLMTLGDIHLGGEDCDMVLVVHCLKLFRQSHSSVDVGALMKNKKVLNRLKVECEKAKRVLSNSQSTTIVVDSLWQGIDFSTTISRHTFDRLCEPIFVKCMNLVTQIISNVNMTPSDICDIVLVGGSCNLLRIQSLLRDYFNRELCMSINLDEAVSAGAAMQGAMIVGNGELGGGELVTLVDIVPLSLGVEVNGGMMKTLIERGTSIPCVSKSVFSTCSDNQPWVNVNIYEGERDMVKYNNLLGSFRLVCSTLEKRNVPQIMVEFKINLDGILHISAWEKGKGVRVDLDVEVCGNSRRFTDTELNKLICDSYINRLGDGECVAMKMKKMGVDEYVYGIKKFMELHFVNGEEDELFRMYELLLILSDYPDDEKIQSIKDEIKKIIDNVVDKTI